MELSPGSVLDRYTVEAVLGEGGMAIVYRVRHNQLGSLHAMKVLTAPGASIRQRLLLEGRVQATLRHPNVVAVTDVVDLDGSPGLIMEYVAGPSLDQLLQRYRPKLEESVALGVGILSGVAFAHKHGLIHRDLKPANVLIASMESGPVPKVADFGLAKLLAPDGANAMQQTRSGVAMGTPSYMSPEQIRDAKNVDKRADVFALGAILYELVTGKLTFPGQDLLTVFNAISDGRYIRVRELRPDLPEHMVQAIEQALAVDPAHRIPDCDTLLQRWCGSKRPAAMLASWSPGFLATIGAPPTPLPGDGPPSSPATWAGGEGSAGMSASEVSLESVEGSQTPGQISRAAAAAPPARRSSRGLLVAGGVVVAALTAGAVIVVAGGWFGDVPATSTVASLPEAVVTQVSPPSQLPSSDVVAAEASDPPVEVAPVDPSTGSVARAPAGPTSRPASLAGSPLAPVPPSPTKSAAAKTTPAASVSAPLATAEAPPAPPVSTAPTPTAPAVSATSATVSLKGDAKRVWLESSAGRFPAGEVPPGTYRVTAFFDSGEPVSVGEITVAAGETRTLRCSSELMVCR